MLAGYYPALRQERPAWLSIASTQSALLAPGDLPPCSQAVSLEEDTLLAAISSRLGASSQQEGAAAVAGGADHGLSADVQQWQVDWRDIKLERVIGGGSFGRVYLGTWKETQVGG